MLSIGHQLDQPTFDLHSVVNNDTQILIPELKQLGSCALAQWCILVLKPYLGLVTNIHQHTFDLYSVVEDDFQTLIPEQKYDLALGHSDVNYIKTLKPCL